MRTDSRERAERGRGRERREGRRGKYGVEKWKEGNTITAT